MTEPAFLRYHFDSMQTNQKENDQVTRNFLKMPALLASVALLCGTSSILAQSAPSLGSAHSFALLGGQTVTVAAIGTIITGDVGTSPGTSITGFPAGGTVVAPFDTHSTDSEAVAAQAMATAVYTELATTGGATLITAELGGTTLNPGTYYFSSSANIAATTTLTLDGAGVYIFQVGSAITANVHSHVNLINGATPCQVFWQVTSAATLNGVDFSGTVVAQAAITLGVDAVLHGRAWTTAAGAVTLAGNNRVSCTDLCATYAAASVETFGYGCYGPEPLEFEPSSFPVMGTIATADIMNVPTPTAAVTIGFTGLPEGVDLSMIGMPGCKLWHSNEHPGFASGPLSASSMRFHCQIPQNCSLVGVDMFLQAYCYAPGANALGLVTSNGLKWTLGF
ncbi:MAG: hypothetical protein ACI85K_003028 [Hyphomicrobiaceae bacterium]|jgi:hypothetical protein